jgi:hypothetical protein
VFALVTGPRLVHLYNTTVASCTADCDAATSAFLGTDRSLRLWLGVLVVVVPGLLGAFWGAPLVAREFEAGTHRLAWTQSVSRTRWTVVKLTVVGLGAAATAGLLSLAVGWWARPLDRAAGDPFASFDGRGVVPAAHAAFAFVLGAAIGLLIRRSVPAMAATLAAYLAVRLSFALTVRPVLLTPVHYDVPLDPVRTGYGSSGTFALFTASNLDADPPPLPGAWITSNRIVDRAGRGLTRQVLDGDCPTLGQHEHPAGGVMHQPVPESVAQRMHECVAKVGQVYHQALTYQPGGRYWTFQWYESAIFLAAAVLLGWFCVRRVLRS